MKRWKIVLPTLLATSGLPLVSLVGCGEKEVPPKPDVIYSLNTLESQGHAASLSVGPIVIHQGKTYQFVIHYNFFEKSWWSYDSNFAIASIGTIVAAAFDVLWVDINGYKFSDKESDDPWYKYLDNKLCLYNYQSRLEGLDDPFLNVYVIPKADDNNAGASFGIIK